MKRKVLYLGNAILIILAIALGYFISYMSGRGIYTSSDFYGDKEVRKNYGNYINSIESYLYTLYTLDANNNASNSFLDAIDFRKILPEKSNIKIRIKNENQEVLKSNLNSDEQIYPIYSGPLGNWAGDNNYIIDIFLADPIVEKDEFYDLYKEYVFLQKAKIPVALIEFIFIILIVVFFWKSIRHIALRFPGDIAIILWILSIMICAVILHKAFALNQYIMRISLTGLAGLIQYIVMLNVVGSIYGQVKEHVFWKSMILSKIDQRNRYVVVIMTFVVCQSLLFFGLFHSSEKWKWTYVCLQGILLAVEVMIVLIWISRNNIRLSSAVEKQMKSERMKTELITNVSHDLKTPITSIINFIDLIKKENIQNEKINEYVEVIDRQSQRLKKLVMDIIEASKASTGNTKLNLIPLDIRELLNQAIGEYEERMRQSELEIVMDTERENDDGEWIIMADGDQLWRVFDNLLSNIRKYSAGGTRVYIETLQAGNEYTVIFKNISRDKLNITGDKLFERFVRGDESRNTEGSGLGLTIAKSLTELMGGKLTVDIEGDMFRAILSFKANNT